MNTSFSCIIPFYNEDENLLSLLSAIKDLPNLKQIIAVDDGSLDTLGSLIKEHYPTVTYIRLATNKGKSEAVKAGLEKATHPNIFLLDADLMNFRKSEAEKGLKAFVKHNADMIVYRVYTTHTSLEAVLNKYLIFSGIRIIKKTHLESIFAKKPKRFQLEAAINEYFLENKILQVYWLQSSAINPNKIVKMGVAMGVYKNIKMELNIIAYTGVLSYIRQIFQTKWRQLG